MRLLIPSGTFGTFAVTLSVSLSVTLLASSCSKSEQEHDDMQAHEVRARLVEPSGLAIAGPGRYWIVDDDRGVLLVDEGKVSFSDRVDRMFDRPTSAEVLSIVRDFRDLEGACVINGNLFVVQEESGMVSSVTSDGKVTPYAILQRPLPPGVRPKENRGFEGIAFWPASVSHDKRDHVVAVHEKHPKAVALFSWPALLPEKHFVLDGELDKELGDLSDVAVDPKTGELLLLSADARKFARVKVGEAGLTLVSFRDVPVRRDEKPEGITVDERGGIWLCTDGSGRLFRLATIE